MILFPYTTPDIAAMMCAIRFPVGASVTPPRTAIRFADKYVLRVEFFELRRVWIKGRIWTR